MFKVKIMLKMRKLFKFSKNYKNYFHFKNIKILSEHEDENHAIDLVFDAKSLYESLYKLFKIELNILKNYLLKNLILNNI